MNVVVRCKGATTALVAGSIRPSACAASVLGFQFAGPWFGIALSCLTVCAARFAALPRWFHPAGNAKDKPMSEFMSHIMVPIAIGAVAIVLLFGLINMMRGGSPHLSQRLMRLRVLMQFIAIIVIMLTIWIMGG